MGHAHSRPAKGAGEIEEQQRAFTPPDQFKFSKVQRLKLTVIQAALTPVVIDDDTGIDEITEAIDNTTLTNTEQTVNNAKLSANSSFDILDPQEAFVATISALIAALNRASEHAPHRNTPDFCKTLHELVKLFTSVFIKNSNIKGFVDVFEFEVDEQEGKVVCEHLLTAYINFICAVKEGVVLDEVLNSFLVLLSSNFHFKGHQERYFHSFLTTKLSFEHLSSLFDSLMELVCTFTYKSSGFIGSVPIISYKSRMASQILACLLVNKNSFFSVLQRLDDLKSFALFIKFQSQIFQFSYPQNLNLSDLTILTILSNSMTKFCPNYRRFVLSKLDNEELMISICKIMFQLKKGKLSKKSVLSMNLQFLAEILFSFSEDSSFIKQTFDSELDRNLVRWYEGDLGTTGSLGGFMFCLLLDLLGANLASSDGFRDQALHQLLTAILANFGQFCVKVDNKSLSDRFWALLNGLFPQIYEAESIDSEASKCAVDVLIILTNIIINNPQGNALIISNCIVDHSRITLFLRSYLDFIDSSTNSQLTAHINEEELEYTAILVGILKCLNKLAKRLEDINLDSSLQCIAAVQSSLATFPIPTFRRDSRGEVHRLGSKMKAVQPVDLDAWTLLIEQPVWSTVYSTIPWNNFVE